MSKKIIVALVIVLVIAVAGYMVLSRNKSSNSLQTSQPTQQGQTQTQNQIKYTSADGFMPSSLTIKAGTTVTFLNTSGQLSVNSNPHPVHTDYPPLNLGVIQEGQSKSLTFDKPGTYGFHNHLNPSQTGTITVQ